MACQAPRRCGMLTRCRATPAGTPGQWQHTPEASSHTLNSAAHRARPRAVFSGLAQRPENGNIRTHNNNRKDALMKNPTLRRALLCAALAGATGAALADEIARVMPGDQALACSDIHAEQSRLDAIIAAGDPQAGAVGKAAAGTAANVGGQVAGGAVAQSVGGLFGALG